MNYWKNKRVLITGYEGFLGSNLVKRLLAYNAAVTGIDIDVRRKKTIFTAGDYKKIAIFKADIKNYALLKKIIHSKKIELVFHLAAQAIVKNAFNNPRRAFYSNITGTWNVLEACRNSNSVTAVICASSDKAYGSHENLPYSEEMPLAGKNPYDVSKSCSDLLAASYVHAYKVPAAITRCGNIYGPGDYNFSRIVPDTIKSALSGKTLLIRSDGEYTRDYVHVEDIIDGCLLLAEKMQVLSPENRAFNFSNENPVSVLDIAKKIYTLFKRNPDYKILNNAQCEIKHQFLSSKKARRVLGWKPRFSLDEGLKNTISWYQKILNP